MLLVAGLAAALCAGEVSPWVAAWPGYVGMVWQYRTPAPGDDLLAALSASGFAGVHLDNGFSDGLLRFVTDHRLPFYVDHTAGKGDLYHQRAEWQTFHEAYRRDRGLAARPRSLHDPEVRRRLTDLVTRNVTRARGGPVVAYAFDDEISTTSFLTPVDLDWSAPAQPAFRAWLRTQYADLAALNQQWGTTYGSFDQAEPLPVDALRSLHRQPFAEWNLSRWSDHRSFMDQALADLLAELVAVANRLDPAHPAGFVGGQAPAAYGGYDWSRLAAAVQFVEAYDIGATNEILRSLFTPARKPRVQTFFSTLDPARDRWFLWYYFVHGNRGVIAWPATGEQSWFTGGRPRAEIAALRPTLEELQGPLADLLTDADFAGSRVALYYSQPSLQVSWFMDIAPHGASWVNRSSSLHSDNASDIWNRWAWLKLLEDLGYQAEFVSGRDVAAHGLDRARFDVLILNRTLALSDAEAAAIRAFAAAGGTVIADYLPGVFDEHGRGRAVGALDDLFGVARDPAAGVLDGQTIAEVNAERYQQPLAQRLSYEGARRWQGRVLYERGLRATTGRAEAIVEGAAAVVRSDRASYLNLTPLAYLLHRADETGAGWRGLVADLLANAGVAPLGTVELLGRATAPPELLRWHRPRATDDFPDVWCLVANPLRQAAVNDAGALAAALDPTPVRVRLRLSAPVRNLRNLRNGRSLGDGRVFEDDWVPCEANVYGAAGP